MCSPEPEYNRKSFGKEEDEKFLTESDQFMAWTFKCVIWPLNVAIVCEVWFVTNMKSIVGLYFHISFLTW